MSDIAVRVENLGKCYQIGQAKSGDFRESFGGWMNKLRGRSNGQAPESKEFWALKDVSFEIKKGEAVGIIGRNGAGKSTLLKILSRITEPTRGRFQINGRVSSLLEVGTGFHPELSGRENIYLNGTILGMKRREIKAKFDEIVAFSGVEKFIDTPVKHYSSGMKVRLAFSVAAHLEPEILIIDEVLAVGDAEFQKKCLGKMDEVSKNEGRTVIFVSHNMGAIKNLCGMGLYLKKGRLSLKGSISCIVENYLNGGNESGSHFRFPEPLENRSAYVTEIIIENSESIPVTVIGVGDPWQIKVKFRVTERLPHFIIGIGFKTIENVFFRTVWSSPIDCQPGEFSAVFREEDIIMASGKFHVVVGLSSRESTIQYLDDAASVNFETYAKKDLAVRSEAGIFLNKMAVSIQSINS